MMVRSPGPIEWIFFLYGMMFMAACTSLSNLNYKNKPKQNKSMQSGHSTFRIHVKNISTLVQQ
jgi:hypothetical protein